MVKGPDGTLKEEVYRAGTPDGSVPPGLYATFLKRANEYLAKAQAVADPQQAKVIGALIRYYQTGEYDDLIKFDTLWVQNNAKVDFANNFIEIYRDANGMKASSQAFVSVTDKPLTTKMEKLAHNAEYFEAEGSVGREVQEDSIHAADGEGDRDHRRDRRLQRDHHRRQSAERKRDSREVRHQELPVHRKQPRLDGRSRSQSDRGVRRRTRRLFSATSSTGSRPTNCMTALHEVIGHGSGKLSPRLKSGSEPYLKEYFSTLEEARADLSALWNVWDPKLKELGLIEGDQDEVAKAMYDSAALVVLTQLRRIPRRRHASKKTISATARSSPTTSWTRPAAFACSTATARRTSKSPTTRR